MRLMKILTLSLIISISIYSQIDYDRMSLNEALIFLEKTMPPKEKLKFKKQEEKKAVNNQHFVMGIWIRNNMLNNPNRISRYFLERGLAHPDDYSYIILLALHRKLNKRKLNIDKEIQRISSLYSGLDPCKELSKRVDSVNCARIKVGDSIQIIMPIDSVLGNDGVYIYNTLGFGCDTSRRHLINYKKLIIRGHVSEIRDFCYELILNVTYLNREDVTVLNQKIEINKKFIFLFSDLWITRLTE